MNRKTIPLVAAVMFINAPLAKGQAYITTLASFNGSNGEFPSCSLIADAAGNLYGTTQMGGAIYNGGPGSGGGTVFEVAAATHDLTAIASFTDTSGGDFPTGGLIADASGNLYGTTAEGGPVRQEGTVFEVTAGTHAVSNLVTFTGTNGAYPFDSLIADPSGNLYGTTSDYGAAGGGGSGTVFEVAAGTHNLTTLANFGDATNGNFPCGSLIADASGNLYGTTESGGGNSGVGTVFEVAAGTHALSTLATFTGTNGKSPFAGLIADASGNLYGTTEMGGEYGDGTVFEVAAGTHTLSTLVSFNGTNGGDPSCSLIADASGNLYGTTQFGGEYGDGTVFQVVTGTNSLSTLASFDGTNGGDPWAGLIADAAGNLYGTTAWGGPSYNGGDSGDGTVFELSDTGFVVPEPTATGLMLLIASAGLFMRRSRTQSV